MILIAQNLCGRRSLRCWYSSCIGEQREWTGVGGKVDGDAGKASKERWEVS